MYLYDAFFSYLVPHSEFDPQAFVADKNVSKDVCAFFLSLSLMFNDFKTIAILHRMLNDKLPNPSPKRASGELAGIRLHVIRLNVALIFELFNLINKNRKLLDDNFFKTVVQSTEPLARERWQNIVEASDQKSDFKKKDTNPFYMIRTKMIFHYEKDDILEGYTEGFLKNSNFPPCISRGNRIIQSRFYFADIAVEGYISKKTDMKTDEFFKKIQQLSEDAGISLVNLCTAFIIKRNFSFRVAKN